MGYSKLDKVEVINFMTLRHAIVGFDENCGIINIKGYNDSGKSALLMSMAVCMMDAFGRKQTKFISHHEDYFRVVCMFDDGVSIIRDKYINGQSLYEMRKDGEVIYTSKEGNRLTKVDGVPEVIEKYLGLCVTEFGCLNYQRKKDPLLLIETKGSQNYNTLHEALKITQISQANNMLNSHKNELASEVAKTEAELQQRTLMYKECSEVTEKLLSALQSREDYAQGCEKKLALVSDISNKVKELEGIPNLPSVDLVKSTKIRKIQGILELVNGLSGLKTYPTVNKVNSDRYSKVSNLIRLQSELAECGKSYPSIERVSTQQLKDLIAIKDSYNQLSDVATSLSETISSIKELSNSIKSYVDAARKKGFAFVKCSNCGTYMNVKVGEGK